MNTTKIIGSAVILLCGMIIHFTGPNLVYLKHNNLLQLTSNYASGLFVFSVLCILLKVRPEWPNVSNKSQKFLLFILEIGMVLYVTNAITRQVWLPALYGLNCVCTFMGEYILVGHKHALKHIAPVTSAFIQHEGFYYGGFCIAILMFTVMLHITGIYGYICSKLRCKVVNTQHVEPQVAFCERCRSQIIDGFRPQIDLLNMTRRGRGRPRRAEKIGN